MDNPDLSTTELLPTPPVRRGVRVFGQPFSRLLLLVSGLAVLLLGILSVQLYSAAWDDAWREVHEKHRVLALNLALPVASYIHDRRHNLASIADDLRVHDVPHSVLLSDQEALLSAYVRGVEGVLSVSLLNAEGALIYSSVGDQQASAATAALANHSAFFHAIARRADYLAGVSPSPFTGRPSLMLGQPVRGADGRVAGVLLAELSTAPIEALRRQVRFGTGGHAAIVDQFGRVVSHPSEAWVKEMHNLSALPVVQTMLSGQTGVAEFISPFAGQDMVAGYAAVPALGWGVMVPQPKQEIAARVRSLLYRQAFWAVLVLTVVTLIAYGMAAFITRPSRMLADEDEDVSFSPASYPPPVPPEPATQTEPLVPYRPERRRSP